MLTKRASGVLLPITALPSPYGVGTFGQAAYDMVDFLVETKQTYWQLLPLTTTSYGDSPYQSFSAVAGNTHLIDLDLLAEAGWLDKASYINCQFGDRPDRVDYERIYSVRRPILEEAVRGFLADNSRADAFAQFVSANASWLDDFALFMALKEHFNNLPLQKWPDRSAILREKKSLDTYRQNLAGAISYHRVTQFFFFSQWEALHAYAKAKKIAIIGDMPIYVSADSVEVWCQPELFKLGEDREPACLAGCPPDAFSEDGQLWGNPIYDWPYHQKTNYAWWVERIRQQFALYDVLRIDHFRGFSDYWEIPAAAETAAEGAWQPGPGLALFEAIKSQLGDLPIIAEDLGEIDEKTRELLTACGFPGMTVLAFAFDTPNGDSTYLPHNCKLNSVAYVGTHDNDVARGWFDQLSSEQQAYVCTYTSSRWAEPISQVMLRTLFAMTSRTAIATMQDVLDLPADTRLNTPSTVGDNWQWRLLAEQVTEDKKAYLTHITTLYHRCNPALLLSQKEEREKAEDDLTVE